MTSRTAEPGRGSETLSARSRLLAAADELFYADGVRTVGIDRVIERAGVAKATLYSTFGSKDELIRAYLAGRHEARKARVMKALADCDTPRAKLLGVFDALGGVLAQPGFRGCAFLNAAAEAPPGSAIEQISDEYRGWVRALFHELAQSQGVADPAALADQLVLLYDGATVGARMDRNPQAAATARAIAAGLVDAATG